MIDDHPDARDVELAERIARRGREVVFERMRMAFAHQAAQAGIDLDPARLEEMVQSAAGRAGEALWRRSLAEAAMGELHIDLAAALAHPALARAQELVGAPVDVTAEAEPESQPEPEPETAPEKLEEAQPEKLEEAQPQDDEPEPEPEPTPEPEPAVILAEPQALRLAAVHLNGIETLRQGDRDIELRLSDAGLDVLKRSSGAAIGRLEWTEIESVALPPPKRGLRGRRRPRELHVSTGRGQAQFELPGLTDDELHDHLEPTLTRLRGGEQVGPST